MAEVPPAIVPATPNLMSLYLKPQEKSEIVVSRELPAITHWGAIREPSQGPTAMEARFTCDACQTATIVKIHVNATPLERQIKMKEALDLHRMICTVGLPEDMRVYRIHYPR